MQNELGNPHQPETSTSWEVVKDVVRCELGLDARYQLASVHVETVGTEAHFAYEVAVPSPHHPERPFPCIRTAIPIEVVQISPEHTQDYLRRAYPNRCYLCGLTQPLGLPETHECFGRLLWRPEAPRPRYYIEPGAPWGYVLNTRLIRFVLDLETQKLITVHNSLHSGAWNHQPAQATIDTLQEVMAQQAIPAIQKVLSGRIHGTIHPQNFSWTLPPWFERTRLL